MSSYIAAAPLIAFGSPHRTTPVLLVTNQSIQESVGRDRRNS